MTTTNGLSNRVQSRAVVLNLEDIFLQAKVSKLRNRLWILHDIIPRRLWYNSNKHRLGGEQPEFDCTCMQEVRLKRERSYSVIHPRLETDLFLSPGHPIE